MTKLTIKEGAFAWLDIGDGSKELVRVRTMHRAQALARCIDADGAWHEGTALTLEPASRPSIEAALKVYNAGVDGHALEWDTVEFLRVGHHGVDPGRIVDDACWLLVQGDTWAGYPLARWHRVSRVDATGSIVMWNGQKLKGTGSAVWAIVAGRSIAELEEEWERAAEPTPLGKLRDRWRP